MIDYIYYFNFLCVSLIMKKLLIAVLLPSALSGMWCWRLHKQPDVYTANYVLYITKNSHEFYLGKLPQELRIELFEYIKGSVLFAREELCRKREQGLFAFAGIKQIDET